MRGRIKQLQKLFPGAQVAALYQEAQIDMTESKKRCPVYSPDLGRVPTHVGGTLRASGHVLRPVTKGKVTHVDLVYGGAAEAYAIVQHEGLDFHHNVGEARYLASVLEESAPHMAARIARRITFNEAMKL
jgi:hypothetical protein